jgi:hypothetical protein
MKTKLNFLLFASVAIFFASCSKYPPTSDRLLEDLAIVTQYDVKANFNQYKTYDIKDTIWKVTDKDTSYITPATSAPIISQIITEMNSRGFVQVTGKAKPDLGITVTYYENTYVYAYYPDYYYYWGYPYYYPYYPVYYSSYTAGMANIVLVDLINQAPNNTLYVRWNAFIRGLLTGTHTDTDIKNAITQAFVQTPQLVTSAK